MSYNFATDSFQIKKPYSRLSSRELYSLGVTAEAILLQRGSVDPKFQVEGVAPHQPFFFSQN